jgi:hypothetical protein
LSPLPPAALFAEKQQNKATVKGTTALFFPRKNGKRKKLPANAQQKAVHSLRKLRL